jgi:DNA modification methylase
VFHEAHRVLVDTGTCWIVIGDCYAGSGKGSGIPSIRNGGGLIPEAERTAPIVMPTGCKHKDLVGVPFEVAKALRNDGWWWRSPIIWNKPNISPQSMTDRLTLDYEYIFLMTKIGVGYFYDQEAIAEPSNCPGDMRYSRSRADHKSAPTSMRNGSRYNTRPVADTRNARSIWHIATTPSGADHPATFPPELPKRCILAGCPPGGTVLDPFAGSGTVGEVALRNGRSAVLIEQNAGYCDSIRARLGVTAQAAE